MLEGGGGGESFRSCACIGSPCLRHRGHGASIGSSAHTGDEPPPQRRRRRRQEEEEAREDAHDVCSDYGSVRQAFVWPRHPPISSSAASSLPGGCERAGRGSEEEPEGEGDEGDEGGGTGCATVANINALLILHSLRSPYVSIRCTCGFYLDVLRQGDRRGSGGGDGERGGVPGRPGGAQQPRHLPRARAAALALAAAAARARAQRGGATAAEMPRTCNSCARNWKVKKWATASWPILRGVMVADSGGADQHRRSPPAPQNSTE
jgi:hypothetical protein